MRAFSTLVVRLLRSERDWRAAGGRGFVTSAAEIVDGRLASRPQVPGQRVVGAALAGGQGGVLSSAFRRSRSGGHADRRADFVTLAKENRAAEMGRFGRPFRKASDLLLGFCRLCHTIYAPRG